MGSSGCLNITVLSTLLVITFSTLSHCGDTEDKKLSTAANCFTLNFYKQLAKTKDSLVSSPFSLDVLLSILRIGAGGKTAQELTTALGYGDLSTSDMADSFKTQLSKLTSSSGNTLEVADSVWIQDGFSIKPSFNVTVVQKFYAQVSNLDFVKHSDEATARINSWGNDRTHGLIPSLFGPHDLGPRTVMVLVNAIYFKGEWASKFQKEETKNGDFYNNDSKNNPSKVKLMHQQNRFKYSSDSTLNAQVLEMDYNGGDMSMVIILPQSGSNIGALEAALTCDNFQNTIESGYDTIVDVTMPKFDISSDFNLKEPIIDSGMKNIFEGSADLSGIAPGIAVSEAIQKAIIKVYEEGSEAAVLTGVSTNRMAAAVREPRIEYFRADHPFLFMIRNKPTNLILFMGRVRDLPNA